jgi:CheY-like chemotaxis protein
MSPRTGPDAEAVRSLRLSRGMTQEELARHLGVSFSTVNAWECGRSRPQQRHRQRLLDLTAEGPPEPPWADRISILCVDDSPLDLEITTTLVRDACDVLGADAEVVGETDPMSALIRLGSLQPAVAFIDVVMGGLDGFAVAERLETPGSRPRTAVALMTASPEPQYRDRARAAGLPLLTKPLTASSVGRILRTVPALRASVR